MKWFDSSTSIGLTLIIRIQEAKKSLLQVLKHSHTSKHFFPTSCHLSVFSKILRQTPSSVDTTACSSTRDSSCCCDNPHTDSLSNHLGRSIPKTCLRPPSPSRPSSL